MLCRLFVWIWTGIKVCQFCALTGAYLPVWPSTAGVCARDSAWWTCSCTFLPWGAAVEQYLWFCTTRWLAAAWPLAFKPYRTPTSRHGWASSDKPRKQLSGDGAVHVRSTSLSAKIYLHGDVQLCEFYLFQQQREVWSYKRAVCWGRTISGWQIGLRQICGCCRDPQDRLLLQPQLWRRLLKYFNVCFEETILCWEIVLRYHVLSPATRCTSPWWAQQLAGREAPAKARHQHEVLRCSATGTCRNGSRVSCANLWWVSTCCLLLLLLKSIRVVFVQQGFL